MNYNIRIINTQVIFPTAGGFVRSVRRELFSGEDIYRCVLGDGRLVMKFINMVKIFYELHQNRIALLDNQK